MATAYEAWRETKEHLKQEPDSTFLQKVEESLRPAALTDLLETFVRNNQDMYDDAVTVDAETQGAFLTRLDELRQPRYREDETRSEMQRQLRKAPNREGGKP